LLSVFDLSSKFTGYKRIFVTSDGKIGSSRGGHAHREQTQILFAIQGSFAIEFTSRNESGTLILNPESDGVLIPNLYWSTQTPLDEKSVLLVFASGLYDENEYIRDRKEFEKVLHD
jgi:hypothetical protein